MDFSGGSGGLHLLLLRIHGVQFLPELLQLLIGHGELALHSVGVQLKPARSV